MDSVQCPVDPHNSEESIVCLRDSFSYRFCDDLSEFILNFLPIDHKIKLTEVSKQFQRCLQNIQRKQRILIISHKKIRDSMYDKNNYPELLTHPSGSSHRLDVKKFVKILQIFPNINEIYIENDYENQKEVFVAIIDNCSHLMSLRLDSSLVSSDIFKRFGQKFGHQIRNLGFLRSFYCDNPLQWIYLPNIVSLFDFELSALFKDQKILIKNLKKATFISTSVYDNELFDIFIDNNLDLIHLGIELYFSSLGTNFLQKLVSLKKLRKLDLKIGSEDGVYYPNESEIVINIIKKCHHLTHLTLGCHLIDEHFIDFDKAFPHLKCLDIKVNNKISNNALESISKLKNLESLSLKTRIIEFNFEPKISESGVMPFINDCKRLRRLEMNFETFISEKMITKCLENKIVLKLIEKKISCGLTVDSDYSDPDSFNSDYSNSDTDSDFENNDN